MTYHVEENGIGKMVSWTLIGNSILHQVQCSNNYIWHPQLRRISHQLVLVEFPPVSELRDILLKSLYLGLWDQDKVSKIH